MLQSMGSQIVRHDGATELKNAFHHTLGADKYCLIPLKRKVKFIESERTLVDARALGVGGGVSGT